jgi:hypothetical protein
VSAPAKWARSWTMRIVATWSPQPSCTTSATRPTSSGLAYISSMAPTTSALLEPNGWPASSPTTPRRRFEIQLRGFGDVLAAYKREQSWASDALTYCDLTTGPTGLPMTFEDRVTEVEQRYGEGKIVDALRQATPYLLGAIERTKDRLRQHVRQARSGDDRLRAALKVVPDPDAD